MSHVPHRPYPKITREFADGALPGGTWVATEKIHGAQLVVATDGTEVRVGKRKAWLEDDDTFFGWQVLRHALTEAVREMHARLADTQALYVYGELFGGAYPHPDVEPTPALHAVQTGVWYSPFLHFAAFDALCVEEAGARFLAPSQLAELAQEVGLHTPPVLGRGPRRELAKLPCRFESRVAEMLGFPPLEDNVAEGFVLRPDVALDPATRPVVKIKIPEFDEARFDEARPFDPTAWPSTDELVHLARRMVNPARVASARSKVGDAPVAVRDEVVLDVMSDLETMLPRRMQGLTADDAAVMEAALEDQLSHLAASEAAAGSAADDYSTQK